MLEQLANRNELPPSVLPELRSIFAAMVPVSTWKVLGPFPLNGGPSLTAEKPVELISKLRRSRGQARVLEDREGG